MRCSRPIRDHPAILGGNIGVPLVERLPSLTSRHRVVLELSELQLPTLSRGTTVAAYTNVTSDHLDRHGSLEAYRAVKRRLAELVDPAGALVLNAEDPVVAEYAAATEASVVTYRRGDVPPGGLGTAHGWIVADRLPAVGGAAPFEGGRVTPIDELGVPGAHNVSNALAASAVALLHGIRPEAIRRAAAAFAGVEHRLERVAEIDGVRFVNDSQGTQPDAVIAALRAFEGPIVLIAGGRDKGVDLGPLAKVVAERATAAVLIGESASMLEGLFRDAGLRAIERAGTLDDAVGVAANARPRGRPRDRRDGHGAAQPRRDQLRHVRGLRGPRAGVQGRGPPPRRRVRRGGRAGRGWRAWRGRHGRDRRGRPGGGVVMGFVARLPFVGRAAPSHGVRTRSADGRRAATLRGAIPVTDAARERRAVATGAAARPSARTGTDVLKRERHQADYSILLAVVALAAIGILMVYSSSAMHAYIQRDDTLAIVGPQIFWGALGLLVMVVVMRIDYRWFRLVSVPAYLIAVVLLILVFVPGLNRVVGGAARWLVIGPLPGVHPAEIAKLALIVYLAHWMANRGKHIGRFRAGTVPFLVIAVPVIALVFKEPDLGTTIVITVTAFTMFFVAGASLWQLGAMSAAGVLGVLLVGLKDYQLERVRTFLDPWADPLGAGFHTIQGLLALGLGGIFGSGLGESKLAGGLYLPNAWNDFIFAIIGEEFGFVGAGLVIALFVLLAYAGIRTSLRAPDTFGALLAAGITAWLCFQAFINIGVVVALLPVTGITLPFISAGGSSLLVSFAAAGVLLSISRETLERRPEPAREADRSDKRAGTKHGAGTNGDGAPAGARAALATGRTAARRTDEAADRGRRDRGPHLPGTRRRDVAPSPTRPD